MNENLVHWPDTLENSILKLKALREEDFEDLLQVASDPAIWAEHPIKDRYKREVFRSYFDQAMLSNAAFLIIDITSDKIIGCTILHNFDVEESSIAIGFTFLARDYWGRAFNIASKKILINYVFQFVNKVYFLVGTENIRPQITLKKLRAKLDRQVDYKHGDQIIRQFKYVISRNDWTMATK
jgi:RimJ/RimL family protein N-acetyltransferase